jgi:hypothetical protein
MTPTGLTAFIIRMLTRDPIDLARADPVKLARKYDIPADTAAGFLKLHLGRGL